MMFLQNKIVKLRALEPNDIDILYKWENNPDIWEVSYTLVPYSKYALAKYIAEESLKDIYESRQLRLVIENIETKKPVGLIDLFEFEPHDMRASVGISINDKNDRGKKFAQNALGLLIEYSFKHLHLNQLFVRIHNDNIPSINLFKGQNFEQCGLLKKWHLTSDGWKDEIQFQLINPEIIN
ncbi:MAG: GNAT family N-acetyltransferase [Bacteroidales bacterium]|nr:GNAT family N-acetyltransferase [Bacteroidales bacterium]